MRQVSKKLGCTTVTMQRYYGELCRAISERHVAYRKAKSEESKQTIRDRVRQATFDLHAQGIYPSTYQIKQFLQEPWIMCRPEAQDAWRTAVRELSLYQ